MGELTVDTNNSELIRAAGGLLWRQSRKGYEIAVVHRKRYDDWTLPKGKLQEGETWQEAALREVKEETGWQATITEFAGAIAYDTGEGEKVVCFWHMEPIKEGMIAKDNEVRKVIWLPIDEAIKKVQYPLERALLTVWKGPGLTDWDSNKKNGTIRGKPTLLSRIQELLSSPSARRLDSTLPIIEAELEVRRIKMGPTWYEPARLLIKQARQANLAGDPDAGWKLTKVADRFMLNGLDPDQLAGQASIILTEASDENKGVSKWRQNSIRDILAPSKTKGDQRNPIPVDVAKVMEAKRLLDENGDNVYQRISILKTRLTLLSVIGVVWLAAWFSISLPIPFENLPAGASNAFDYLVNSPSSFWLVITLSGILGALISSFTSAIGSDAKKTRIPTEISTLTITMARIIVGSLSAIAITLFLGSGILTFPNLSFSFLFAVAIISGFSDRLFMNAIERIVKPG